MPIGDLSAYAGAAVREAMRPKSTGRMLDSHASRYQHEPEPDVERMRQAVSGAKEPQKVDPSSDGQAS